MVWIFLVLILIFSVIIHEVSHGAAADYLGDPTARNAGRLSLNPIRHMDLFGSFLLPLFCILANLRIIFGWAKPVPINPYNFRDQKYGSAKVASAGPAANLLIALFFGLILRLFSVISAIPSLHLIFSYIVYINIILGVFNLIPLPPLDGHHILFAFLPRDMENVKIFLNKYGLLLLLFIVFFLFDWLVLIAQWIFSLITGAPLI